jgi:rsbT co-antagonist protein RsbR
MGRSVIARIVRQFESDLLAEWLAAQRSVPRSIGQGQLEAESAEFLHAFADALERGSAEDAEGAEWERTHELLEVLSQSRAKLGFTPTEATMFVLSLKQPLFERLKTEIPDAAALTREIVRASNLLDGLGLAAAEAYQKSREEIIGRQQQELLELSTPVIRLWDGILAVPLIGTLDSERTQIVMETLLTQLVNTGAQIAVIDITGVPTVDTIVAQHLLKTVGAARLMGADCVISGIRPQIAQTIVHLGVQLNDVVTKATLADAFRYALGLRGLSVLSADSPRG